MFLKIIFRLKKIIIFNINYFKMIKHFINNLKTKKKSLKSSNYNYFFKTSLFILFSIVLFLFRKEIIKDYKPLNKFN